MTKQDYITLFAPAVAAIVLALATLIAALITGWSGKLSAYFASKGQANAAAAAASAGTVISNATTTVGAVIAGEISRGELNYTDRNAVVARAQQEAKIVETRIPQMIAIAQPVGDALVANIMGKVDAAVVASPSLDAAGKPVGTAPAVPAVSNTVVPLKGAL